MTLRTHRRILVGLTCVVWSTLGQIPQGQTPAVPEISRIDIACAPAISAAPPDGEPRIVGDHEGLPRSYFARADTLALDRGREHGIAVDQEYFVRRISASGPYGRQKPPILHTAGWVRIVSVDDDTALATVVHACGALRPGDFLEPMVWPADIRPSLPGDPDYAHPGVILFGLDGRSFIATHEYFVFGLETMSAVVPGQRLTVFRQPIAGRETVTVLGHAVIVRVDPDTTSATAWLLRSRDAVEAGDRIASHR